MFLRGVNIGVRHIVFRVIEEGSDMAKIGIMLMMDTLMAELRNCLSMQMRIVKMALEFFTA